MMIDRHMAVDATATLSRLPARRRLWAARCGWVLVVLFVAGVLTANLPHAVQDTRVEWQVGEAWPVARDLFATRDAFARWLVASRLLSGLVFFGTALLLA